MAKLKVFRTAAGFHDAYVAAPSRKAALKAWRADADLFARRVAEEVTDNALTAAPLAHPGEVIKVSRGSAAEQLAEAGRAMPKAEPKWKPEATKPKPSRAKLDKAEAALAEVEERHRGDDRALAEEQKALDRRKRDMAAAHKRERIDQGSVAAAERAKYDAALEKWRV